MAPPTIPQPPSTPALRCEVLGQASVTVGDTRLAAEGELVFALALFLALNAGSEISRDAVAHMLWPACDDDGGRHCLRQLVYRLRALGLPIAPSGDTLDLSPEQVVLDVGPLFTPEPSREAYLQVARFDVLPDYAPEISAPYARWVEQVREQLGVKLRNGLMACIADARARGRYREVLQLATHCLALDPLNEEATLGLAEATALAGNKVRALQMLDAYRVDLGAAPTLSLQTDLLRRRIAERLNVYGTHPDDVPMIGRDDAVEFLLRGMHALSSGKLQAALVLGEAGVGKTRLLSEFQKIAAVHGVRTVTLRCHPGWQDQPLTAITELATILLQLPGALGCSPDAMTALRELTSAVPRRSDAALYATDADAMLAHLRWAVFDLCEAVMQERRFVLLLDNLQWMDGLSESFLEYVMQRCAKRPLYVVMTARDEETQRADVKAHPLLATEPRLPLNPLSDADARSLVRHVVELTDRSLPEYAIEDCVKRCGGNPYFLSELARFFLVAGPGAAAPVTLRTFIEFRLGKVSRAARRALQVVAILGAYSNMGRVRRVLQLSGYSVLNALEELQLAGLIQLENERCECRHDVVREVAEAGMSGIATRVLHLRAAREFKREAVTSKEPALLFECGRHLLRSGDTDRAPRGALILANRLLELGAAEGAEELARTSSRQSAVPATQARAKVVLARALRAVGKWEELDSMRAFVATHSASLGANSAAEIRIHAAEARLQIGGPRADVLETLAEDAENEQHSWLVRLLAARLTLIIADNKWDLSLVNRVAPIIERAPSNGQRIAILRTAAQVILATIQRRHVDAADLAEKLLELKREAKSTSLVHHCDKIAAHCFYRLGDLERARELFIECLERSANWGRYYSAYFDHLFLAIVELQAGNVTMALRHIADAKDVGKSVGVVWDMMLSLEILRVEALVEAGEQPSMSQFEYRKLRAAAIAADPRYYQSLLAIRLVQLADRGSAKTIRSLRDELRAALRQFSGGGWQDFPTFGLAYSHFAAGDTGEARSLVSEYITSLRPERSKLRPRLSALAAQLNVASGPPSGT